MFSYSFLFLLLFYSLFHDFLYTNQLLIFKSDLKSFLMRQKCEQQQQRQNTFMQNCELSNCGPTCSMTPFVFLIKLNTPISSLRSSKHDPDMTLLLLCPSIL